MALSKEFQAKLDRHETATIKTKEFIAAGGDIESEEGQKLGLEMIKAANDLRSAFARPFLKNSTQK